jgi:hypothetical protein
MLAISRLWAKDILSPLVEALGSCQRGHCVGAGGQQAANERVDYERVGGNSMVLVLDGEEELFLSVRLLR